MKTRLLRLVAALALLLVPAGGLWAIAPPYVSDSGLARYSVIVVAKWEKAPFTAHHREEKRDDRTVITAVEAYTELKVERVIAGDLKPGAHKVMVGLGISWDGEGKWVSTGTSTELMGDARDITNPHIWFLEKEHSWDPQDKTEYLSISNYRAIQPANLEAYFRALGSAHPGTEMPKLLSSNETDVVRRALRYTAGGLWPWPWDGDFEASYQKIEKGTVLRDQAPAVATVIERKEMKELRSLATAVYAELEGGKCVPLMRTLAADQDPDVRATAVAVLARHKDSESLPGIVSALNGKENSAVALPIIQAFAEWKDIRVVPALIAFLESDQSAYRRGDDFGVPAQNAREVLHTTTGHWFPFDVKASQEAWKTAAQTSDAAKRLQVLREQLPNDPNPLQAELFGDGSAKAVCKITNKSKQNVILTRLPEDGDQRTSTSLTGSAPVMQPKGKEDFVTLKPGETFECPVELGEYFLRPAATARELTLHYASIGRDWGQHAWIGALKVKIGAGWKAPKRR